MSDLSNVRKKEIRITGDYSNKIRKCLQDSNITLSKEMDGIPTDLGDIHEVCRQYLHAIDMLISYKEKNEKKVLTDIFKQIRNDLYIHLKYHLKELEKPLNILIDELYEEEDPS
jgi:flagellar biosynthesis chaperone FliJ